MCPIYGSFTGPRRSLKHFTQSGETFRCHRGKVGACWSMRIGLLPGAYAWLILCNVSCCSGCESSIGRCLPRRCSASCVRPTGWIPSAALPWSVQCWSCQSIGKCPCLPLSWRVSSTCHPSPWWRSLPLPSACRLSQVSRPPAGKGRNVRAFPGFRWQWSQSHSPCLLRVPGSPFEQSELLVCSRFLEPIFGLDFYTNLCIFLQIT